MGKEWIQALQIIVHNINQLTKDNEPLKINLTTKIYKTYHELFENKKFGTLPKLQAQPL